MSHYSVYPFHLFLFVSSGEIADYLSESYAILPIDQVKRYFVLSDADSDAKLQEICNHFQWIIDHDTQSVQLHKSEQEEELEPAAAVQTTTTSSSSSSSSASASSSTSSQQSQTQSALPSRKFIAHTLKRIAEFERVF